MEVGVTSAGSSRGVMSSTLSVGWGGREVAVAAALQPPAAFVNGAMMSPAQQGQVGQVGGATVQPVNQVVGLTPGRRPIAAGEPTAAVADG